MPDHRDVFDKEKIEFNEASIDYFLEHYNWNSEAQSQFCKYGGHRLCLLERYLSKTVDLCHPYSHNYSAQTIRDKFLNEKQLSTLIEKTPQANWNEEAFMILNRVSIICSHCTYIRSNHIEQIVSKLSVSIKKNKAKFARSLKPLLIQGVEAGSYSTNTLLHILQLSQVTSGKIFRREIYKMVNGNKLLELFDISEDKKFLDKELCHSKKPSLESSNLSKI